MLDVLECTEEFGKAQDSHLEFGKTKGTWSS